MTKHDPIHIRTVETRVNSYDPETRTVEAVIATTTPVVRRDARGPFLEILTAGTLDISSTEGMPVLDSHRTASVRDVIGRVLSIKIDGDQVIATLQISKADDVEPIAQRIADGSVTGISIGYRVAGWNENKTAKGRTKTPNKWRITEVTLTSNPADPNARIRHETYGANQMTDTLEVIPPDQVEKQRRTEIRSLVRTAGLGPEVADDLIDAGADMTRAKAEIFDAAQSKASTTPIIRTHAPANDDPSVIQRRATDALVYRMQGGDLAKDARPFVNMSLLDMARDSLTRAGVSVRSMSADETFQRAAEHGGSDFPLLISNAANKSAMASYTAAQSPLKTLCRQRTLSNFKETSSIRLGEMGRLEKLSESGEITHTSRGENGETMHLENFARGMTVSRNLLINDDLHLLSDMTAAFGEAAAQTEADILVNLLLSNPNLSDGTPVFDASRGNIMAAGLVTQASLDETRQAMRTRTGLDGKTLINATPRYVLVGADRETEAEQILAAIQPNKTDDVNPFGGKLSLMVEPRITDGSWFVFADPTRLASMQYAYLSSAQGVQIQRTEAWDTLGMKYRAFLDFGAGWLDWRGANKNEGA